MRTDRRPASQQRRQIALRRQVESAHHADDDPDARQQPEETGVEFCQSVHVVRAERLQVFAVERADRRVGLLDCPAGLFPFLYNDPATREIYTLPLHDALPLTSATAA